MSSQNNKNNIGTAISSNESVTSADVPGNNIRGTFRGHEDDATHQLARLSASRRIRHDRSQCDECAQLAALYPAGTLGEAVVADRLLQGPVFSDWVVARRKPLTRNDLAIADTHLDVSFTLSFETLVATFEMVAQMQGFYQVPRDLGSDRISFLIVFCPEFVTEMKLAFDRVNNGSEASLTSESA